MLTGFSHAQLLSLLWPTVGIAPNTLTTGNSINTYDVAPQPAAGIDTWGAGTTMFGNLLVLINVSQATAGTLTVYLYDSGSAITTANGAASTTKVATLADISDVGLYYAELMFTHVFADTAARVVSDEDNISVRRYHSIRATATGGTFTFDVLNIYGWNCRDFPTQVADELAITWATT